MAVRYNQTQSLTRTTNLSSVCTIMGWFQIVTDTNNYNALIWGSTGAATTRILLELDVNGTSLAVYNGTTSAVGTNLTAGTWNHLAIVHGGSGANNLRGYLNGVLDCQVAGNGTAYDTLRIGEGLGGEDFNGRLAALKMYDAVLTAEEILTESRQYVPVRWTNLNAWYPLWSVNDVADYSANARAWTVGGTFTTEEGPPIPWRMRRKRKPAYTVTAAGGNRRRRVIMCGSR